MPKPVPKSRFRNRKLNFKARVTVRVGSFDLGDDVLDYGEVDDDGEPMRSSQRPRKVETGVDKEEEHELHLQNAISASAAAYSGRGLPQIPGAPGSPLKAAPVPFIPTPDATGQAANWEKLYPLKNFSESATYIRFSDTVEDSIGVVYTMDEDDEEWLEKYNEQAKAELAMHKENASATGADDAGTRNRDGSSQDPPPGPLTEDEFECIMDLFETQTEEKVPLLHLDVSRIPTLADLEEAFESPENACLYHLKNAARRVYLHWKARRLQRNGKIIMPQLDYDETREDNPYVCFRRRDPKNVRKTRRTDAQNVDRLIRLSTDLVAARDMMLKVLERERVKRELLGTELQIFEGRTQLRELKRKVGEKDGDEALLIGKREKRRKPNLEDLPVQQSLKVPLRISRPDNAHTVPATPAIAEPIMPYKDRTASIQSRIDRDLAKKRDADRDFEDFTDGAYHPPHLAAPARYWRTPESYSLIVADGHVKGHACTFGQAYPYALGGLRPSFRRRTGRNGRIYLDRITSFPPSSEEEADADTDMDDEEKEQLARLADRWKFDSDAQDLPGAGADLIIDDFAPVYTNSRINLLRPEDVRSLHPSGVFLEEAWKWASKEPEKRPQTQVVGKLPLKALPPPAPIPLPPQMQAMPMVQPAQAQAVLNSMQQVAHGHQVAQPPQLKRSSSASPMAPNGSPMPNLRRIPSGPLPNGMPMPNTIQQQQQLAQWQAMNGMIPTGKMDPITYQNLANHMLQQNGGGQVNGMHMPPRVMPNGFPFQQPMSVQGANRMPATSRLASAPFSAAPPMPGGIEMMNGADPLMASVLASSPSRSATPQLPPEASPGMRTRRSPQMHRSGLNNEAQLPYPQSQPA